MLNDLARALAPGICIYFGCTIWHQSGDQWHYYKFIGTLDECKAHIDKTFSELNKKLNNDTMG